MWEAVLGCRDAGAGGEWTWPWLVIEGDGCWEVGWSWLVTTTAGTVAGAVARGWAWRGETKSVFRVFMRVASNGSARECWRPIGVVGLEERGLDLRRCVTHVHRHTRDLNHSMEEQD